MSKHQQKKGVPVQGTRVRQKALELLDDEEWHDYERVIARLIPLVPPGQAYRAAEDRRKWQSMRRTGGEALPRQKNADSARIIRSGARALVKGVLHGGREFEITPLGEEPRRIRLHKDRMAYWGWRKPEDVTPRVRGIVRMLQEGRTMEEIAAEFDVTESTVSSSLKGAVIQLEADSSSQFTLPKLMVERGLVPPSPPMTDVEKRWIDDVRQYRNAQPELIARRLKITRLEELHVRRRLMVRWGVRTTQEMIQRIRDGSLKEE